MMHACSPQTRAGTLGNGYARNRDPLTAQHARDTAGIPVRGLVMPGYRMDDTGMDKPIALNVVAAGKPTSNSR